MQPLDALTLFHFAGELDLKLADGKLNKIQQANHHEVLLHFWVGADAGRQKLYINIKPEYSFCSLVHDTSFLTFPQKAYNFCMLLRKHLTNARVQSVNSLPGERVLNLTFENYNELGQRVCLVLSIELMGKHSNMILYDKDINLILGCGHGVSDTMSSLREISVGYPYVPPPRPSKPLLQTLSPQALKHALTEALTQQADPAVFLTQQYLGTSKAVFADLFSLCPSAEPAYSTLRDLLEGNHLYPAIKTDFSHFSLLPQHLNQPDWQPYPQVSAMVEAYFTTHLLTNRLQQEKQRLAQVIRHQQKKLTQQQQELEKTDTETLMWLKKSGDLLTIATSQGLSPQGTRLEMMDYETQEPVTIDIDPTLSLSENAQLYYRRYKKAQLRAAKAQEIALSLEQTRQFIAQIQSALDLAQSLEDISALKEDLEAQGWIKSQTQDKKKSKGSSPMVVVSSEGFTILIGKNNLQNEQIVGKLAKPDDIWLHTHHIPGSHVLIKTEKQAVPNQTLEEAAMCAVYFSQARHSVNVPVVYTQSRYVRKIPNSYPGHVTYTHEQALNITASAEAMHTLLATQKASPSISFR